MLPRGGPVHLLICMVDVTDIRMKCNRCKRIVVIKTRGVIGVEYESESTLPNTTGRLLQPE